MTEGGRKKAGEKILWIYVFVWVRKREMERGRGEQRLRR